METENISMNEKLGLIGEEYAKRFQDIVYYSFDHNMTLGETINYIEEKYPDISTKEKMWHASKIAQMMIDTRPNGLMIRALLRQRKNQK